MIDAVLWGVQSIFAFISLDGIKQFLMLLSAFILGMVACSILKPLKVPRKKNNSE